MLIIPVIDISQGVVVQATKSDRKSYKPIKSSISDNPDPESILTSFGHELLNNFLKSNIK